MVVQCSLFCRNFMIIFSFLIWGVVWFCWEYLAVVSLNKWLFLSSEKPEIRNGWALHGGDGAGLGGALRRRLGWGPTSLDYFPAYSLPISCLFPASFPAYFAREVNAIESFECKDRQISSSCARYAVLLRTYLSNSTFVSLYMTSSTYETCLLVPDDQNEFYRVPRWS